MPLRVSGARCEPTKDADFVTACERYGEIEDAGVGSVGESDRQIAAETPTCLFRSPLADEVENRVEGIGGVDQR